MKISSLLLAAVLAGTCMAAEAATVESASSYQLLNVSIDPGLSAKWLAPDPFAHTARDGSGTSATGSGARGVSATAATDGRSGVPMDYATALVISRDRLVLFNSGPYQAIFGAHILPRLMVSITGNNDGQSRPEGLSGELGTATAAINIFLTIFRPDGSESQSTLFNAAFDLGFGDVGTRQGTGGGINGLAFASGLLPGERAELTFEMSAGANAWHADPLADPVPSPVPLPAGIVLLPGALALLVGLRRRRPT